MRKGLIILNDLQDTDLIWLAREGEILDLKRRDQLIQEGQITKDLFVITEGSFDVKWQHKTVAQLGVGDVLGEMSFVEKQPASATVTAAVESRVLAVPQKTLLARFELDQGFAARFYRALAVFLSDRLRSMNHGSSAAVLDEGLLDNLHVAGDRMLRLIDLLGLRSLEP